MTELAPISSRRRRTDVVMRGLLGVATIVALVPLVLVIYYLFYKGLSAWSKDFFTTDPNGNFLGYPGGIRSAILGTIEIVALATLISVPIGIGVALYLTEYGKDSKFANVVRYFVDVMTGVPSIVFGLFIYIVLVLARTGGSTFAAWKGSIALSLLMLPIVIRSSEVVLLLVPGSLREAALALGAPRWRVVTRVVLPTSFVGAGDGRAAGDRPRRRRDGPAAVHRRVRTGVDRELEPVDELAADPDLQRHPVATCRSCHARLGRSAYAGADDPASQPDRARRLAKEPPRMNPEIDTKNKDATDVSSPDQPAGQPQQTAEPAEAPSAQTKRTAHSVTVTDLHAYYGSQESIKGISIEVPGQRGHGPDRPLRLG